MLPSVEVGSLNSESQGRPDCSHSLTRLVDSGVRGGLGGIKVASVRVHRHPPQSLQSLQEAGENCR